MNKKSRGRFARGLSVLLAASLLASVLPLAGLSASAESMKGAYFIDGNPPFAYLITDVRPNNTAKLYQDSNMQSYESYTGTYAIPDRVYNADDMSYYTVTEIGGASASGAVLGALQSVPLRGVELPGTLTTIGAQAFADCRNLSEVVFPSSVVRLSEDSFQGTSLQKLTLDVVTDSTLLDGSAYTTGSRAVPIALPHSVTDLNVRSPLTVSGQTDIPGETVISGSRIVVQAGSSLTLHGALSGAGVIQVGNDATLTLYASSPAFTGSIRLTGAVSKLVNSTSAPVTVVDASGKSAVVNPGETRIGGQKDEPPVDDPNDANRPQITTNHGGTVTVQDGGKVIVITPFPNYHVEEVVINGLSMQNVTRYEFQEASAQNTVAVTFAKGKKPVGPDEPVIDPVFTFTDVSPDAPYAEAVRFLVNNGIFQGVSQHKFAPGQETTRAMFVSLLKRMEVYGEDFQLTCESPVYPDDVAEDAWYAESAAWAAATGIFPWNGREFRPQQNITRREFAVCLYRYTHQRGYDTVLDNARLFAYQDIGNLSLYSEARRAMAWAATNGYLPVRSGGYLNPGKAVTRAEMAQALALYLKLN